MDYAAYGEYMALSAQMRDAAGRRYALMRNAAALLHRGAEAPDNDGELLQRVRQMLDDFEVAQREAAAAMARANQAADLCGQRRLTVADLRPFKD